MLYLNTEEEFDENTYLPSETSKMFKGAGVYDYDGNKYQVLKDEGGTTHYIIDIVENYSQTKDNLKLISNLKIISLPVLN